MDLNIKYNVHTVQLSHCEDVIFLYIMIWRLKFILA